MNVLIYLLASLGCAGLAIQNWFQQKEYNAAHHYSILAALVAISFATFGFNLLFGPTVVRCVYPLIACFVPASLMSFLLAWLRIESSSIPKYFWSISTLFGVFYIVMKITIYPTFEGTTPAEFLPVLWLGGGGIYGCSFLWKFVMDSKEFHQRQRLQYLFLLLIGTTISLLIEASVRTQIPETDLSNVPLREKISLLQGSVPPFGAAFATLTLYVLHLNVKLTRLISLQELFSRLASKSVASLVLTFLIAISLALSSGYPLHIGFQIFLICGLFLAIYPDLQAPLDFLTNQLLNRQGAHLKSSLMDLEKDITKMVEQKELDHAILSKIHEAGRTESVSLYIWDHDHGLFQLRNHYGMGTPIPAIGQGPFVSSFEYGDIRQQFLVEKQAKKGIEAAVGNLRIMEQMESELCIPLWSDDVIVGWINFKSDPMFGGFSSEEIRQLKKLVDKTAMAMDTIRSVDQLKEQHRLAALGTMSAGLAHEIRNPLAGIKGAAQYLQDGAGDEEIPAFLQLIISEADRLNSVVGQFLDYSRPLNPQKEYIDVNRLLEDSIAVARASLHKSNMYWRTEFDQRLPNIRIDANLFQQVLLNLFQNAAQACHFDGQIVVRSKLSKCKNPPQIGQPAVELQVEDNGSGIPSEVKEKLFIPFFTTKEKGTGLGLAMIQRILEVHDGEIQVFSHPGEGATFVIRLPILEMQ